MKKILASLFVFLVLFAPVSVHAAITESALDSGNSTVDATSYTTGTFQPTANNLVLIAILNRVGAGTANIPTVTGNNVTWVEVTNLSNGNSRRLTILRALGSAPSSGTATIDLAGQTQSQCKWSIAQFSGVDTSGTNGSGAIVQTGKHTVGTSTSYLVTLSAFGNAMNVAYGAVYHASNENTVVGTGFNEIHDLGDAENASVLQTEYLVNDNTVDASWASSVSRMAIALEIKASSIKTIDGLANGSIKTVNGLARASMKSFDGLE